MFSAIVASRIFLPPVAYVTQSVQNLWVRLAILEVIFLVRIDILKHKWPFSVWNWTITAGVALLLVLINLQLFLIAFILYFPDESPAVDRCCHFLIAIMADLVPLLFHGRPSLHFSQAIPILLRKSTMFLNDGCSIIWFVVKRIQNEFERLILWLVLVAWIIGVYVDWGASIAGLV